MPMDSLSAQPELVSDKGTKVTEFVDDFVIISDGADKNPNYFVTKVDGSSSERCWDCLLYTSDAADE